MKVHVYDTHVNMTNGNYYHFDVLVSDNTKEKAVEFAAVYLLSLGISKADIKQQQCDFCHTETVNPAVQKAIECEGFYIIPMQGCPQV